MFYYLVRFTLSIFTLCFSINCFSKPPTSVDLLTRFIEYNVTYTINQDGSSTTHWHQQLQILKNQALANNKSYPISYSKSRQKLEVLSAYTLKANGTRIKVPQTNFQIQENSGKDANIPPAISDINVMTIIFPDLEVGDSIVITAQLTDIAPLFANHFWTIITFPKTQAFDNVRIKVDIPASMWFQYQALDLKEISNIEKNNRKIIKWVYQNVQPIKSARTDYSVYDIEQEPGLIFSTFQNYAAIAEAYGSRARDKAQLTKRIQQLADQLTQDKKTPTDVARTLYEWVAKEITYVKNNVGIGTFVPRNLDFVLDNRMGDCKDHVTLLQTLLAAKGIPSTQVLINSNNLYQLPKIPSLIFDHVIIYIPSLNLYLDPTSNTTPFGMLPFGDQDKSVLWIDNYQAEKRTPAFDWQSNQSITKTDITVQKDGTLVGKTSKAVKGALAEQARAYFRNMQKDDEPHFLSNLLQRHGYTGIATLSKEDASALLSTYQYHVDFALKNQVPSSGGLAIQSLFDIDPTIAQTIAFNEHIHEGNLSFDYACHGGELTEEYIYRFPNGTRILSIPKNIDYKNGHSSYQARYRKQGNTVHAKFHFIIRNGDTNVCQAHRRIWNQTAAKKLLPNLKMQIMYQMPTSK